MITFKNVNKIYPPRIQALKDVSFEVAKGEFVSVVGKSGAGKTTLLKVLIGEEHPTAGEVFYQKQNVHRMSADEMSHFRRGTGTIFQDYRLLSSFTLCENISYVLEAVGVQPEEIKEEVREVLDLVGLQERADRFPHQLSGGEAQRAAIARAIVHRPALVLADEPTGNLDPYYTKDVINLLVKLNSLGASVILATHNKEIVNNLKKRVITLEDGQIIRDDPTGKFIL